MTNTSSTGTRKLKCSGESPRCSRCTREDIRCVYSPQKQMGRPRKRRREDADENSQLNGTILQDTGVGSISEAEFASYSGLISPPELDDLAGFSEFQHQRNGTDHLSTHPIHDHSGFSDDFLQESDLNINFPADSAIDPSLWDPTHVSEGSTVDPSLTQAPQAPCSCLSVMYLTSSDLQTLSSFSFPAVVPQLRRAVSTALDIVRCEKCPKENFGAIQNVQALSLLLSAIAERYHKVLSEINSEAERLERSGGKKPFRVGDNNPSLHHLHTGTLDCPMGFDLELEPQDWKKLAKKALKTEVMGGGHNATPFALLLDLFEERQNKWHKYHANNEERKRIFGVTNMCKPGDAMCVRMITAVRKMVENMDWD
ncbi:hypothetical protein B0J11DRAFT_445313 [Dendryphion nanum]|uniref:Zn(2)-C6 fungal-type domain-containing protein n=1 Tax=Dendryphion nanum TaxID=256645 RepID=A0A9P9D8T7_9PLEO|nr:hypothetical protein B0J11DRAFT_445313 [Dendryphion nanum]